MASNAHLIVMPGQIITVEQGYLRGHGTYVEEGEDGGSRLVASVAGVVERVNKLISVRPIKSRYIAEVGDLIVGRITEVQNKRWKVDIRGLKDSVLALSSANLPGAVQRIRTYEDQLQMRTFFEENDLISAEVQQVHGDGGVALHTRNLKYGKLENGQLVCVPPPLVRRLKQHMVSLPGTGVDIILGNNGYVWVTRTPPSQWGTKDEVNDLGLPKVEALTLQRKLHAETPITAKEREKICRVRNSVLVLGRVFALVSPDSVMQVYKRSLEAGLAPKDMLAGEAVLELTRPG